MKTAIIYHKDLDGYASAMIVKRKYPEAVMIPMQHGDSFPWNLVENKGMDEIYLLDFVMHHDEEEYLFADMARLSKACRHLIWIDHHVSARRNYVEDCYMNPMEPAICLYVYDPNFAACELTWRYINPDSFGNIPRFIRLIGSADTWRDHDKPVWKDEIEPFVLGMQMVNTDPAHSMVGWNTLIEGADNVVNVDDIISDGKTIMRFEEMRNKKAAERDAHEVIFEGYSCIAINANNHNSQILDSVFDADKHKIRLIYSLNKDQKWYVSVYSENPVVDCSTICKKYGGGGHRGAGGFLCAELPWWN